MNTKGNVSLRKMDGCIPFGLEMDVKPYCTTDGAGAGVCITFGLWGFWFGQHTPTRCALKFLAFMCSTAPRISLFTVVENTTLELVGVVSHSGTLKSGHYVAFVKRAGHEAVPVEGETTDNETALEEVVGSVEGMVLVEQAPKTPPPLRVEQWYYVSDTQVSMVSVSKVLACEAYVLIYARRT